MSFKRLLSKDEATGIENWMHMDGDTIAIEKRQDLTGILEANKKARNEFERYGNAFAHHYAHIPLLVIEKWRNEDGIDVFNPDHAAAVRRKLNDPDWQALRTTTGTI